jgi:hypothetical protein
MPMPTKPMRKKAQKESFKWTVKPAGGVIEGTVYTDGSALDGPNPNLVRCGWAFVVLDNEGNVTASASGVPPPWIDDIGGAEAWALLQAALRAVPGKCRYKVDCEPCVNAVQVGIKVATAASKPHARVHGLMLMALEDTAKNRVVWMPSHKGAKHVGVLRCSDGELLTETDIKGNDIADKLAKQAVKEHRVGRGDVETWVSHCVDARAMATWIARATHLGNNCDEFPYKDSAASRSKAEAARHKREIEKLAKTKLPKEEKANIPRRQDGHVVVKEVVWGGKKATNKVKQIAKLRTGWRCTVCRAASSNKTSFELERCTGGVEDRQLTQVSKRVSDLFKKADGHRRVHSGTVEWCHLCGCFSENRSKGLSAFCTGIPRRGTDYGGMWGQRRKLLQGIHPKSGKPMPMPRNGDGTLWQGAGDEGARDYLQGRASSSGKRERDDGFYWYEPDKFIKVSARSSMQTQSSFDEILARVRAKAANPKDDASTL